MLKEQAQVYDDIFDHTDQIEQGSHTKRPNLKQGIQILSWYTYYKILNGSNNHIALLA